MRVDIDKFSDYGKVPSTTEKNHYHISYIHINSTNLNQ